MKSFMKGMLVMAAALVVLGAMPASAADGERATFTKDVLPILQENCQTCHRPAGRNMSGMIAPMSLMTYREVRPWAKSIARAVQTKEMPPWDASPEFNGHFQNERVLTAEEVDTIVEWVESGAPRGNPSDAPEPITFREGWFLGEADLVLEMEPYFVDDDVQDLYFNHTIKITQEQLPENKWVQSLEFKPGSEAVHHIIAYSAGPEKAASTAGRNENLEEDEEFLRNRTMLGGLAPGTDPTNYPEGYGIELEAGSEVTFAMHYHKEPGPGTGVWDTSEMAFKFHEKPVTHALIFTNIAHGAFEIPPNADDWRVVGAKTFKEDITLISLMPHMHLRGVYAKYTAYYPDGTEEVLLEVPEYDFNWQTQYEFKDLKHIPAGTRIEFDMHFDNNEEQAAIAGIDPSRAVRFGGPTTDEMDLGWYTFATVRPSETDATEE